jgi:hypothetical protein
VTNASAIAGMHKAAWYCLSVYFTFNNLAKTKHKELKFNRKAEFGAASI